MTAENPYYPTPNAPEPKPENLPLVTPVPKNPTWRKGWPLAPNQPLDTPWTKPAPLDDPSKTG